MNTPDSATGWQKEDYRTQILNQCAVLSIQWGTRQNNHDDQSEAPLLTFPSYVSLWEHRQ